MVAYWLNFEGNDIEGDYGYTGKYTCKYSQGLLTPVLANADGSNALHRIRYNKNNGRLPLLVLKLMLTVVMN